MNHPPSRARARFLKRSCSWITADSRGGASSYGGSLPFEPRGPPAGKSPFPRPDRSLCRSPESACRHRPQVDKVDVGECLAQFSLGPIKNTVPRDGGTRPQAPWSPRSHWPQDANQLCDMSEALMLAYLVIREGSKWTDVFRLVPGQTVTIGRRRRTTSSSRTSAAAAAMPSCFSPRDVGRCAIWIAATARSSATAWCAATIALPPGDIIRIGRSQLAFVHDLSKAFPDSGSASRHTPSRPRQAAAETACRKSASFDGHEPTHDHASPRPDEISRAARRGQMTPASEGRPRRRQAVPAGLRAGQEPPTP